VYNLKSNAGYRTDPLAKDNDLSDKSKFIIWLGIIWIVGLTKEIDPPNVEVKSIVSGISLIAL
jgi:hypothetical protein